MKEEESTPSGAALKLSDITTLARKYDVSLRTLRFYEQRGLLNPIRVGSQRMYSSIEEIRLQIIIKSKRFGFSLLEIERMIGSERLGKAKTIPSNEINNFMNVRQIQTQIAKLEIERDEIALALRELVQTANARRS